MSSSGAVLSWSQISKRYGRRTLFSGLSGELFAGQVFVVAGGNGVGKSTFLKMAAGLLAPTSGSFSASSVHRIGYCSPALELYADLSGAENLEFFAAVSGVEASRYMELIELVGLVGAEKRLYSAYSSGMKQRLKLAFALLRSPQLLILDEPTIALDVDGVGIVDSIIANHRASNGAALIASNDPHEVARWSDFRIDLGNKR